jgi:carbamoyltransferase
MSVILGIGGLVHDSNLTLLVDGVPKIILEEERLSRKKHVGGEWDLSFSVLRERYGLKLGDVDFVAVSRESFPEFHSEKQRGFERIVSNFEKAKIIHVKHHLTHAANAFYPSGFDKAAILTVDGLGDNESASLGIGEGGIITPFSTIAERDSIGLQWIRLSNFLGYPDIFSAGKIMGLASYGIPKYYEMYKKIINFDDCGKYSIETGEYDARAILRMWDKEIVYFMSEICPPRKKGEEFTQIHMDMAASLQRVTEDVVLHMANHLYEKTACENICLSGGVALNGFVNQKILEQTRFRNMFVQPACSDCGDGLGAALYVYHQLLGGKERWTMKDAYLGREFNGEIKAAIPNGALHEKIENIEKVSAELISEGYIVGWYQGRSEFGPRALGNRSILADPRAEAMKQILNQKVKHREWFRPFAPSALNEHSEEYFGINDSPYMLRISDVKKTGVPAITHVDNTARVQTVSERTNSKYHRLISEFHRITGVPLVLNTSFNDDGEPIVDSPDDAIKTFYKTEIDYLVMGDYLIKKPYSN